MNPEGCGAKFAPGQWWNYCGETDMGQGGGALCTRCGGSFIRGDKGVAQSDLKWIRALAKTNDWYLEETGYVRDDCSEYTVTTGKIFDLGFRSEPDRRYAVRLHFRYFGHQEPPFDNVAGWRVCAESFIGTEIEFSPENRPSPEAAYQDFLSCLVDKANTFLELRAKLVKAARPVTT